MNFAKRYAKLNESQKNAVDKVDGPVMVIAGPGTGKTELLSVRVANILQVTDTLPENILCLTFTESGANAMRERLTEIIGKEAYKVAVHTFHSFGTEVINQNGKYFYQGAHFRPADQLSSYEIINEIFKELEYNSLIASKLNNEYTHLSDSQTTISELKKSGLTSDELLNILDNNNDVIEKVEQLLSPIFAERITKNTAIQIAKNVEIIKNINEKSVITSVVPLSRIIADSLQSATDESIESNSTKPMTAWRNAWFTKDETGKFILKSHERQQKLRSLCVVYEQYLTKMSEAALYDFDDMILRVVHAMEIFDDLRFNLQEKYQYIMVDEFQDTNMAQMRIIHNLTNNEAHGDTPNIMVVGDDDQAIYSFQGADISNVLDFQTNYPKTERITLTENYRSTAKILDGSRDIIIQGNERLENKIESLDKKLNANVDIAGNDVQLFEASTIAAERQFIAQDIKKRIESGQNPNEITILTRRHNEINELLPYLYKSGIAVNYERRDNVLDQPLIILIEKISQLLIYISTNRHDDANAILPEILAHKAWGIDPLQLWKLSIKAYDNHTRWLDVMTTSSEFAAIHKWIIETAALIATTPLEQVLDIIIGKSDDTENSDIFISPIYNYFFSKEKLESNPEEYLTYLESLKVIRTKLKEYRPDQIPTLFSFIEFIALNRKIGSTLSIVRQSSNTSNAINVMTAHKSKGLEFETVYVMNVVDTVWGERARSRNRLINYPENLQLAPAGENEDERLRLFYVAITRAKHNLNISYSLLNDNNKSTLRAAFLINTKWGITSIDDQCNTEKLTETAELAWYQSVVNPKTVKMHELLMPTLDNYKLSVTHLNNFLDVSRGGPTMFLLNNLLRFPQAKSPNAAFGTAIHDTLQQAHDHLLSTNKKQTVEEIISNFELNLTNQHLNKPDLNIFLQKGIDSLRTFLNEKYDTFSSTEQTELNFSNQHSIIEKAHITGKLDLVDIDTVNKIINVTDYKTGKPSTSWQGKTDFEKIKLHKYKQQLLFYKLLIENSRDYSKYKVSTGTMQFVEPTKLGKIIALEANFSDEEIIRFSKLINVVWDHIIELNLPDTSTYEQSYKGMLLFEQDLIDGLI